MLLTPSMRCAGKSVAATTLPNDLGRPRQQHRYVSALVFGGNPSAILELVEPGWFEVSVSDPFKADVQPVLGLKFSWSKTRIDDATSYLWSSARDTSPQQTVTDCVDLGDNHLLQLHPYQGISILTPKQFLGAKPWQG